MLNRQYGVAASSSIVKVAHPEDSQPNERIQGRNINLPPKLNTVRPPRFSRISSNSSRLGTQLARRGTWNTRVPTRPRQENSSWSNPGHSGPHHPPEAPTSRPTTSPLPATHRVQQSSSIPWTRCGSLSPKLPLEPIRRRTPLDAPRYRPSDRPPLPGRKRKSTEVPPSDLPLSQKPKIEQPKLPSLPPDIKREPSSETFATSRKLVNEACSFWPIPDNCRKSDPDYPRNRREFAKSKNKELIKLGLKRTKVFFREDGLVIEWRSQVPVWSDTLLPEKPLPEPVTPPKTPPAGVSRDSSKRKRDVIEIIDVDALPETPPLKKSRPTDHQPSTSYTQKQSSPDQRPPPSKKRKAPERHWSAGLSKNDIRKLGRGVEAASMKPPPPSSSLAAPSNSCDKDALASMPPVSPPRKRLALPTRLTPSERKIVSAAYTSTLSSPDRDKEARSTLDTATSSTQCPGRSATANSNSNQETVSKPGLIDDIEVLLALFLESTNKMDAGVEESMNAHDDGEAFPEDGEVQHLATGDSNSSQETISKPESNNNGGDILLPPQSTPVFLSTNEEGAGTEVSMNSHADGEVLPEGGEDQRSVGQLATGDSNSSQEPISKPQLNDDGDPPQPTSVFLESNNEVNAAPEMSMNAHVDASVTVGAALPEGGEDEHLEGRLVTTSDSNSSQEAISKPQLNDDGDLPQSTPVFLDEVGAGAEMTMNAHADGEALPEGGEDQRLVRQLATGDSNSNQEAISKPQLKDDGDPPQSTPVFLESTNEVNAGPEMSMNAHVDASVGEDPGRLATMGDSNPSQETISKPQSGLDVLLPQLTPVVLDEVGAGAEMTMNAHANGEGLPEGGGDSNSSQETTSEPQLNNGGDILLLSQSTPVFVGPTNGVGVGAEVWMNGHGNASFSETFPEDGEAQHLATGDSNASQESISKPELNNGGDLPQSTPVFLESTAGAEMEMNAHGDASVGEALPEGGATQHLENHSECDNDSGPQISQNMEQVEEKSGNLNPDEVALFEAESQEIERLCTDLPEYDMAEDFLRQFISSFDGDRNELKMAYSDDALLSIREPSTEPGTTPSSSSKSTLHAGRAKIIDKLNGLIGYHFSPVGAPGTTINFDIAVLSQEVIDCDPREEGSAIDKEAVGGVLATLHSQILRSDLGQDHTMTLHQSFVLRRRTELDDPVDVGLDESSDEVSWPLIVISHHMILRDEGLLPPSQLSIIHRTDQL